MKVKELLDGPEKWCQGAAAVDINGNDCEIEDGIKWCLVGAVCHCYDDANDRERVGDRLRSIIGGSSIVSFNDSPRTTFAKVRALLEKADV